MIEKIMPREVQLGLNLILYELFHVNADDLREMPPFGEANKKYFARFSDAKINKIGTAIEWALENEHYPFNKIYPRQSNIGNDLIINYLKCTLIGLVNYGLYRSKNT